MVLETSFEEEATGASVELEGAVAGGTKAGVEGTGDDALSDGDCVTVLDGVVSSGCAIVSTGSASSAASIKVLPKTIQIMDVTVAVITMVSNRSKNFISCL